MQIGFIHADNDELRKVKMLWKSIATEGAIDELGIGRIRDYFSDRMFPGTSTLWTHAKYLTLLPILYLEAREKRYDSIREVHENIIRLERLMTQSLIDGCKKKGKETSGIIGRKSIKNNKKYVKYDPSYIYFAGMRNYGILNTSNIANSIYKYSKIKHNQPDRLNRIINEELGINEDWESLFEFCVRPTGRVDNIRDCSIELTYDEAAFLKDKILKSSRCEGSLLSYILSNKIDISADYEKFESAILPDDLRQLFDDARAFSKLVEGEYLMYNYAFSLHNPEATTARCTSKDAMTQERLRYDFDRWVDDWKRMDVDINEVQSRIMDGKVRCDSAWDFCMRFDGMCGDLSRGWGDLISLVTEREYRVKGSRNKIKNRMIYDPLHITHKNSLTYRWGTVQMLVNEINMGLENRKEVENG